MNKSEAWVDADGGLAAFVYAEGGFSACRDLDGRWVSPAPRVTLGDLLEDGYVKAGAADAATLLNEARLGLVEAIKVPDQFPAGSEFVPTFGGDWFVDLPGKGWFKLSDDGSTLDPRPGMAPGRAGAPRGGISFSTDPSGLLADAAASRRWTAARTGT